MGRRAGRLSGVIVGVGSVAALTMATTGVTIGPIVVPLRTLFNWTVAVAGDAGAGELRATAGRAPGPPYRLALNG